jgi:hypothetical protein
MLAFIILALINIMILLQTKKTSSGGGKGWTVYGTMGCGWTRKQLEYMKKNGAFPTLKHPNGEIIVGYNEI